MADTFDDVIFSGKFDNGGIKQALGEVSGSIKTLEDRNRSLNAELERTRANLASSEAGIRKLRGEIAGLDSTEKGYDNTNKAMLARMRELEAQVAGSTKRFGELQKELDESRAKVQMSGEGCKLVIPHNGGADFRQFTLTHFRKTIIHPGAHHKIQHGIAEKLKTLIILQRVRVFVDIGAMSERARQQSQI